MTPGIAGLPEVIQKEYVALRELPDGRVLGVHRLIFHWTMHVDIDPIGYGERWCYYDVNDALTALATWDGQGDAPGNWHRHPDSGRRRDPQTGEITFDRD